MTHEAAAKMTAEIILSTIQHMADSVGRTFEEVFNLVVIEKETNAVKRFKAYMDLATEAAKA